MEEPRIQEIFDSFQKYDSDDVFEKFLSGEFFRYGPAERVAVLTGWDKKMEMEIQPSRATAALIEKKRRLDDMHALLVRGGR
jgi:hypothetical protein